MWLQGASEDAILRMVLRWLREEGLTQLQAIFVEHALADLADISELTEGDIQTLVGPQLGPRKRLARAVRNLAFRRGIVGKGLLYSKDKVEKGVAVSKGALGEGGKVPSSRSRLCPQRPRASRKGNPKPYTLNPKHQTPNTKHQTPNTKTPNTK
ncbi:hypothetical protein T484DRAFT_1913403, partial [Baffinella frigidus]